MTSSGVLMRVEADPHIGLGHLQRCLSVSAALERRGADVAFLVNDDARATARVARAQLESLTVDAESWSDDDAERTAELAADRDFDTVIVDSDYEGERYLAQLRDAGLFVVAIEDIAPHPFPCQLVVNGDAHATRLEYEAIADDTRFLLGPEYSILRPEFWDVPVRSTKPTVERVLLTLGGGDPLRLMPSFIAGISAARYPFDLTVVVGPFVDDREGVERALAKARRSVTVVDAPDSMRKLMEEADLAVSAGGQTLYELARAGCPTIAVSIAGNQDGQLDVFEEEGSVRVLRGASTAAAIADLSNEVASFVASDRETRAAMAAAGQRMIDGQGASRVADAILASGRAAACPPAGGTRRRLNQ